MGSVGLLTIHDTVNFGSLLQTFSTYKALEELEVDTTLIDYKCRAIQNRENLHKLRDCRRPADLAKYFLMHKCLKRKYDNFWSFIKNNIKISEPYDELTIDKANDTFDSFIVGSDIVWGEEITGCDFNYMLEFAKKDKTKIAFSSSVGEDWNDKYQDHIKVLLARFSEISVREDKAAKWIEGLINRKIEVTCDPTMLMPKGFWDKYTYRDKAPDGAYIVIYLRTSDKRNITDAINYGKSNNIPVYYINYGKPIKGVHNIKPESLEEWLSLIKYANTVFTASYHGYLFSLYFQKDFFFYYNTNVWRMQSLTKWLNIPYREGIRNNIRRNSKIDYCRVNDLIEDMRMRSFEVLDKMLISSGIK